MFTIVGLGNPGEKYLLTRHNAGRIALVEALAKADFPANDLASGRLGKLVYGKIGEGEVLAIFPDTYMNESGRTVVKFVSKDDSEQLIVVYDDIDLPIGEFKISFGKGDGGHNGVSSIISSLGTRDFVRVRIGIARKNFFGKILRPKGEDLARYVLSDFSKGELDKLRGISDELCEALDTIVNKGVSMAMNKFN